MLVPFSLLHAMVDGCECRVPDAESRKPLPHLPPNISPTGHRTPIFPSNAIELTGVIAHFVLARPLEARIQSCPISPCTCELAGGAQRRGWTLCRFLPRRAERLSSATSPSPDSHRGKWVRRLKKGPQRLAFARSEAENSELMSSKSRRTSSVPQTYSHWKFGTTKNCPDNSPRETSFDSIV